MAKVEGLPHLVEEVGEGIILFWLPHVRQIASDEQQVRFEHYAGTRRRFSTLGVSMIGEVA
jgi:hypothetical protein